MQGTYDKLLSEVPKYKMITPSILSDRLRVSAVHALAHGVGHVDVTWTRGSSTSWRTHNTLLET